MSRKHGRGIVVGHGGYIPEAMEGISAALGGGQGYVWPREHESATESQDAPSPGACSAAEGGLTFPKTTTGPLLECAERRADGGAWAC
jgi:hypothetical protein